MLRFLSGRGRKGKNSQENGGGGQNKVTGPATSGGVSSFHTLKSGKPNKNCILCKVIVLDGTDLSIELPVSHQYFIHLALLRLTYSTDTSSLCYECRLLQGIVRTKLKDEIRLLVGFGLAFWFVLFIIQPPTMIVELSHFYFDIGS